MIYDLRLALENIGITSLNEMQEASLRAYKQSDNIILLSPTGSGKTLAFLLPLTVKKTIYKP